MKPIPPMPVAPTAAPASLTPAQAHQAVRQELARMHAARRDCGSGRDYGICKACGKGHGDVLMENGTSLV